MGYEEVKSSEMWEAKKDGDQLEGEVVGEREGQYGRQLSIKTADDVVYTPSHKVLQSRLEQIKDGDKIRITFLGEEKPSKKGNNPTKMYKVERDV